MAVELSFDERKLLRLAKAMRSEADGKELRRDLVKEMRTALNPTRNAVRTSIRSMPSHGHAGVKLRGKVAGKVMVQIKAGGKHPGAALKAKKTPNVRRFTNAPALLNARRGWRHPVPGQQGTVRQIGKPLWFDGPVRRDRGKHRRAAKKVLSNAERRLRRKV